MLQWRRFNFFDLSKNVDGGQISDTLKVIIKQLSMYLIHKNYFYVNREHKYARHPVDMATLFSEIQKEMFIWSTECLRFPLLVPMN